MIKEYFLWLFKFVTVIVVCLVGIPLCFALIAAVVSKDAGVQTSGKDVGVVELTGEIFDVKEVVDHLYEQARNPSIAAIVLRIDSPGGAVGPSQELYETVKVLKERKPIVASMGMVAASGGLYAALPATKIFANPGTLTGSIGVIGQFPNFTGISEKVGFSMITVKSGGMKDVGNPFRPFTEDDRAYLEGTLKGVHQQFIGAVIESRKLPADQVALFADGRVLTGAQAKELKVIDELGGVYDAAREALALAGKPLGKDELPRLVYAEDKFSKFRRIISDAQGSLRKMVPTAQIQFLAF